MCRPSTRNRSTHQSTGETPRDTKHPRGMASGLTYMCVRTHMCVSHSVVSDFSVTARVVASQVPLSMELSRQEYWSGLPFPPPGDLPDPGIEPGPPALQADSLPSEPEGFIHKGGYQIRSHLSAPPPTQTQDSRSNGSPLQLCSLRTYTLLNKARVKF